MFIITLKKAPCIKDSKSQNFKMHKRGERRGIHAEVAGIQKRSYKVQ
jgi:hypothetical protein